MSSVAREAVDVVVVRGEVGVAADLHGFRRGGSVLKLSAEKMGELRFGSSNICPCGQQIDCNEMPPPPQPLFNCQDYL
jgi:hypothetical protein